MGNDMLSELDIDTLKDIPDNKDARQSDSGSGDNCDHVESNVSEDEHNTSDNKSN